MKILMSGSSGLVGSALVPFLEEKGHELVRIVRSPSFSAKKTILWNLQEPISDLKAFESFDAVIHLAGESVVSGRWNAAKKARIRESRVHSTYFLSEALRRLQNPPKVFACASAVGYYGNRGDEILTEQSPRGKGFLAETCEEWEGACDPARQKGLRVVSLRFGILLSPQGGALAKMLLPFKLGLGGRIGSGRQYMSWMTLADVLRGIEWVLKEKELQGPVNFVSPHPVTNREFTKTLGKVLGRPTFLTIPAFATKLAFGELADEAFLASVRAEPKRLFESKFSFNNEYLENSLKDLL